MKRMKMILPIMAFAIAIFASAFTAPKKSSHKFSSLYWYRITYNVDHPDGAVLNSNDFFVQDDKANVSSPCSPGSVKDCLRGFSSQISTFPEEASGSDQIKKP